MLTDKWEAYRKLKGLGYSPSTAVDGGYALGEWTGGIKSVFSDIKVLGIDANSQIFNDGGAELKEGCLLWSENDIKLPFHRNANPSGWCTGDSIFRENSQHYTDESTRIEYMQTKTLNKVCAEHEIEKVDILKLDVQGAEIECLKGFSNYIDSVDFVELEVAVLEYNLNAPGIYEVFKFMEEHFEVYDVLEAHYAAQIYNLIQIDFLFVNRNFPIERMT